MSCIRSKHAMKVQPGRFEKIRKLLRRLQWHCRPLRSLVYSHVCMSGAVSCRTLHIVVISLQAAAALQLDSIFFIHTLLFTQQIVELQLRQLELKIMFWNVFTRNLSPRQTSNTTFLQDQLVCHENLLPKFWEAVNAYKSLDV